MRCHDSEGEFLRLAAIETDDHVLWPYAKGGQRRYGQVYIDRVSRYTHREALLRRVPQPSPDQRYVLHGPGCPPHCMNYRHLRWGTAAQNASDQKRDGTKRLGEGHHNARLTNAQVAEIRRRYKRGPRDYHGRGPGPSQKELAVEFGVFVTTINRVIRKGWNGEPVGVE